MRTHIHTHMSDLGLEGAGRADHKMPFIRGSRLCELEESSVCAIPVPHSINRNNTLNGFLISLSTACFKEKKNVYLELQAPC